MECFWSALTMPVPLNPQGFFGVNACIVTDDALHICTPKNAFQFVVIITNLWKVCVLIQIRLFDP